MYAQIVAAIQSTRALSDLLNAAKSLSNYNELVAAVSEVNSKLMDATAVALASQEAQSRLSARVVDLESKLAEIQDWEKRISQYELTETAGGAVVYKYTKKPEHYICPSCISKKVIQILQDNRTHTGKYRCVGCGAEFPINPRRPPPRVKVTGL